MKAAGIRRDTRARLKKLMIEGHTAEEISSTISVEQSSVENWMEHLVETGEVEASGGFELILPTMDNKKPEILAFAEKIGLDIDEEDTKEELLDAIGEHINSI